MQPPKHTFEIPLFCTILECYAAAVFASYVYLMSARWINNSFLEKKTFILKIMSVMRSVKYKETHMHYFHLDF